jgi:hypothetical protein
MNQSLLLKTIPTISQLKQKLDPDNTQIILKSIFIKELFPEDQKSNKEFSGPLNGKPFIIYHYNGLPRSNKNKKVRYASAQAIIEDYGYGNDTPISAVGPVIPGQIFN